MTGKNGALLEHVDSNGRIVVDPADGRRMFAFTAPKPCKKQADSYLLPLGVVGKVLAQQVDNRETVAHRLFRYKWPSKELNAELAEKLLLDFALTMQVFPYVFGIIPESEGRIFVPAGYTLHMRVCKNIFTYLDTDRILG